MNLKILGASSLASFTRSITQGLIQEGAGLDENQKIDAGIVQIHGAPQSKDQDKVILETSITYDFPIVYLIHRPDEVLEHLDFIQIIKSRQNPRFILLGDLIFHLNFWSERRDLCKIIPHPFLDLTLPPKGDKISLGAFTSWGEMRNFNHFLGLAEHLRDCDKFIFKVGGPGLNQKQVPPYIEISHDYFVPHFNVQLYHLHGKKRYGETSGSLHRGVSIPVIFEANGAEKIENFFHIKVEADDELTQIKFDRAANKILQMSSQTIQTKLEHNLKQAQKNSPQIFARSILQYLSQELINKGHFND